MTEQIKTRPDSFVVQKHFGPEMADIVINDEVHSAMIKLTDKIIDDKKSESHGASLAGVIEKELRIYKSDMIDAGVSEFMESCVQGYIKHCLFKKINNEFSHLDDDTITKMKNNVRIYSEINSAWIVSQRQNEYNPAHSHNGCEVSGVLYLKIPNVKNRRNLETKSNRPDMDGDIQFIYSSASKRDGDCLDEGIRTVIPADKKMVLFPSYLTHLVYPFIGDEERRCVAFNASYQGLQLVGKNENGKAEFNWLAGSKKGVGQDFYYDKEKP